MFTFDPEGFAAGRQDVRLGCLADDAFGQRRRNLPDHVLSQLSAHKEDLPVTDKGQQTNERVLGFATINPSADITSAAVGTSSRDRSAQPDR